MKTRTVLIIVLSWFLILAQLNTALAASPSQIPFAGEASTKSSGLGERRAPAEQDVRVVRADSRSIELLLQTPPFEITTERSDAGPCQLLRVDGYGETATPGWPSLPVRGTMVGIPAQAELSLTILESRAETAADRYDLCPVPQLVDEWDISAQVARVNEVRIRNAQAYATDAFYPPAVAEVVSTAFIRSQRVAQVRFTPFQYNPRTGELRYYRMIRVRLDLRGQNREAATTPVDEGIFEGILNQTLANYEQARQWRASTTAPATLSTLSSSRLVIDVSVSQDGLYRLTYADLQAAGLAVAQVDPRTFRLHNRGTEVAIYVAGEEDGSFDSADYLLFYGQKMNSRYTDVNVYRLSWGEAAGLRMSAVDGQPVHNTPTPAHFRTTQRLEKDYIYTSKYTSGADNDHWYWSQVFATSAVSLQYTTTLQHLATTPYSATVRGLLHGLTIYPSSITRHHARIYLNSRLIHDATWPVATPYAFEVQVPSTYLNEGANTITVNVPKDHSGIYELLYINRFEIDYGRTYTASNNQLAFDGDMGGTWTYHLQGFSTDAATILDITNPFAPVRILNASVASSGDTYNYTFEHTTSGESRYLALSPQQWLSPLRVAAVQIGNLRSPNNSADYIIITHSSFYTAVQPLADYRAAQGLRTSVVDVQNVYNEFSDGIFDPEAIRSFLAYAYENWARPAPSYVLLVGDGNYDFKNNTGRGEPSFIPPYLANIDLWNGEAPADNRYVCVSGNDVLPDMHIGRLPVKTAAEAAALVAKIIGYEQNPPTGQWNQRVVFLADNADSAGDFAQYSDILVNGYLPAPYQAERIYLGVTHPYQNPAVTARTTFINVINQGSLLVNYIGHAGVLLWASESLFGTAYVPQLANSGRLPLVVTMACSDGYFVLPSDASYDFSSTSERLVRAPTTGAIASWAATGLGLAYYHDFLNRGLFEAIFFDNATRLGPATMQGKFYLYAHTSGGSDQIEQYTLFGDPALALDILDTDVHISQSAEPAGDLRPGDAITYTLTYANSGPLTAYNVTITDLLPAALVSPVVSYSGAAITPRTGNRFVWDVANLAPGEGGTITVRAIVDASFSGMFSNTVTIATTSPDRNPTNNSTGPAFSQVLSPDVTISLQGPAQAHTGQAVTYVVEYRNEGQSPAAGVIVSVVPGVTNLALVRTSPPATILPGSSTLTWAVGTLPAGAGGSVAITMRINIVQNTTLTTTASISTTTVEANQLNNSTALETQVVSRRNIRVERPGTGNKPPLPPGSGGSTTRR